MEEFLIIGFIIIAYSLLIISLEISGLRNAVEAHKRERVRGDGCKEVV